MKSGRTLATFTMAALGFAIALRAQAGPGYGTWLSAGLSATPVGARHVEYRWSLQNAGPPLNVQVRPHHTVKVRFAIQASRQLADEDFKMGVHGEVCLENHGPVRTLGLRIRTHLGTANGTEWIETADSLAANTQGAGQGHNEILPEGDLEPGERRCYRYRIESRLRSEREQRVRSSIHIDNFVDGRDRGDSTLEVFTPFESLHNLEASVSNREARLKTTLDCPGTFACTISQLPPTLSDSTTLHYEVTLTNKRHKRGALLRIQSTTALVEADSGNERRAKANIIVNTGARCGD